MRKDWQQLLRPEVAAAYVAIQEPGRYRLRSLDYQEIDLRTLSQAEADELVARPGGSEYLRRKRKRRSTSSKAVGL